VLGSDPEENKGIPLAQIPALLLYSAVAELDHGKNRSLI
jgi:hypothetical protein